MIGKKKLKHKIKRVNEYLSDDQIEDLCQSTNLCEPMRNSINVEVIDIEEMQEKLYKYRLEQQTDLNNIAYFKDQIKSREIEIERLERKIDRMESEYINGI